MSSKEIIDPIVGFSSKNAKNDILIFKDEVLKDVKEAQKKVNEKYQILNNEVMERINYFERRITAYETKIEQLSNLINTDNAIRGKVDSLMAFKEETSDTLLKEKIRLDNIRSDLNSNVNRIDDILKDSVLYPGIIGGISKYKTFHNLIDYVLTECSQNLTFREKSILDLKEYKKKLEDIIKAFNTQTNNILNTTSEYTRNSIEKCEKNLKSMFNVYDDRLQDARVENANYAIGLEKASELLRKELENLNVIKKELYEKVDNGVIETKNDNERVIKLFTGYKRNFHILQHKFTQLSDFIKDIRFRINIKQDVNRREYSKMSDLINFDKRNKPGFYDGVYDTQKLFKVGFGSQLKDYIEGKIPANQLFNRKQTSISKSVRKRNDNFFDNRKNIIETNLNFPEKSEDTKLNFKDLRTSLKKKTLDIIFLKQIQNEFKKDAIKEEEEYVMKPREKKDMLSKTIRVKNVNNYFSEKDQEIDKKKEKRKEYENIFDEEIIKDEKINEQKIEESKIQTISKDKDKNKDKDKEKYKENDKEKDKNKEKEKDKDKDKNKDKDRGKDIDKDIDRNKDEKEKEKDKDKDKDKNKDRGKDKDIDKDRNKNEKEKENKSENKDRPNMKKVLNNLFVSKDIMNNIKNQDDNSPQKENVSFQNEKKKIKILKYNFQKISCN